jgi:hypothetical protein
MWSTVSAMTATEMAAAVGSRTSWCIDPGHMPPRWGAAARHTLHTRLGVRDLPTSCPRAGNRDHVIAELGGHHFRHAKHRSSEVASSQAGLGTEIATQYGRAIFQPSTISFTVVVRAQTVVPDPGDPGQSGKGTGMTTDQSETYDTVSPPRTSESACLDGTEHSWRRIHAEERVRTWTYRCEVCRRTLAGLVV